MDLEFERLLWLKDNEGDDQNDLTENNWINFIIFRSPLQNS